MNTCATCKHWKMGPNGAIEHGACIKIENGSWDDIALTGYCDDFGDHAALYTRADFGCTLWQARDGVLGNMMTDGRSSWPKEGE